MLSKQSTGQTATGEQLKKWVDYARQNKALILYDALMRLYPRSGAAAQYL